MLKQSCVLCKIVGLLVIIGALNWGLVGLLHMNLVEQIFGMGTTITQVIYILVGVSGLVLLASYFVTCPGCKKQ
ncbi:MAG: DUF378 domain-containing protein [Candidatus Omnitrophica bacterium]|nr:DUF378 domain-containing protein [Candidatus Omnitrophota bacterium]